MFLFPVPFRCFTCFPGQTRLVFHFPRHLENFPLVTPTIYAESGFRSWVLTQSSDFAPCHLGFPSCLWSSPLVGSGTPANSACFPFSTPLSRVLSPFHAHHILRILDFADGYTQNQVILLCAILASHPVCVPHHW